MTLVNYMIYSTKKKNLEQEYSHLKSNFIFVTFICFAKLKMRIKIVVLLSAFISIDKRHSSLKYAFNFLRK